MTQTNQGSVVFLNFHNDIVHDALGRYDLLGKQAAKAIPGARLIAFPELGHAPQMEAPERFHAALLSALRAGD